MGCEFAHINGEESSIVPNDAEVPKVECDLNWATWSELITTGPKEIFLVIASITLFIGIGGIGFWDFLN